MQVRGTSLPYLPADGIGKGRTILSASGFPRNKERTALSLQQHSSDSQFWGGVLGTGWLRSQEAACALEKECGILAVELQGKERKDLRLRREGDDLGDALKFQGQSIGQRAN